MKPLHPTVTPKQLSVVFDLLRHSSDQAPYKRCDKEPDGLNQEYGG